MLRLRSFTNETNEEKISFVARCLINFLLFQLVFVYVYTIIDVTIDSWKTPKCNDFKSENFAYVLLMSSTFIIQSN